MSQPASPRVRTGRPSSPRRPETHIRRQCDHRAGAGAHAVDRGDDRLRAVAHRLDEIAGHPGEREQLRRRHLRQRPDDLVDVAARAEVAAGAADHHALHVARVDESAEEIAQLRVRVERQRILLLRPVERDRRHLRRRRRHASGSASPRSRATPARDATSSCSISRRRRCIRRSRIPRRMSSSASRAAHVERSRSAGVRPPTMSFDPVLMLRRHRVECTLSLGRQPDRAARAGRPDRAPLDQPLGDQGGR